MKIIKVICLNWLKLHQLQNFSQPLRNWWIRLLEFLNLFSLVFSLLKPTIRGELLFSRPSMLMEALALARAYKAQNEDSNPLFRFSSKWNQSQNTPKTQPYNQTTSLPCTSKTILSPFIHNPHSLTTPQTAHPTPLIEQNPLLPTLPSRFASYANGALRQVWEGFML